MEILDPKTDARAVVLVIHSWWGLTDSFRRYGRSLAEAGHVVGLADLFHGETADTADGARRLRSRPRRLPIYRSLGGDLDSLRAHAGGPRCPLGVVGFSMGGHWAVWLSQRPEYEISSTILYYAARGGDFSKCTSAIQAHFAANDAWVRPAARRTMERAIDKAGCEYRAFEYPDAPHWFAEVSQTSAFDENASRLALSRDIEHLSRLA